MITDTNGFVHRNGKRDSHEAARAGINLAVDANHLAPHINQRPTGISRIDSHIGLDERQEVTRVPLLGTDNSSSHRIFQTERGAYGHHPLTNLETVDITHLDNGQTDSFNFHQGNIGTLVRAHNAGLELASVGQGNQHLISPFYDVGIGHDETIG